MILTPESACRALSQAGFQCSPMGDFDLRTMVSGTADPWEVYAEVCSRPALARQIGEAVGAILAEQHTRVHAADVAGWLRVRPQWPESRAWIHERLPRVVDDPMLIADADAVMDAYDNVVVTPFDCCLVHADVGLHNLGIEADSYAVRGLFDYDDAAWADRHHDFHYLEQDLRWSRLALARVGLMGAANRAARRDTMSTAGKAGPCGTTIRLVASSRVTSMQRPTARA